MAKRQPPVPTLESLLAVRDTHDITLRDGYGYLVISPEDLRVTVCAVGLMACAQDFLAIQTQIDARRKGEIIDGYTTVFGVTDARGYDAADLIALEAGFEGNCECHYGTCRLLPRRARCQRTARLEEFHSLGIALWREIHPERE